MALYEIKEEKERVILVGVSTRENDDTEDSLDELKDLVKTAGAEAVGRVIQKRELVHPGTYVGKGKIEEIRELLWELDATGIVCDDELSPAQMNNLTDILDVKVMDRTMVILDIFAGRASTSEGKIQVELAQLRYRASVCRDWKITVKTGRRNRYKRSGRKKAGNGSPSYPGADQSSEKRTGRCGAAQRIAPQSAESVRNESGSTGRIYVSRKKQY